jgi:predicted small secreted protein
MDGIKPLSRRPDMYRTAVKLPVILLLPLCVSACNTWAGFGKDLKHLGKSIEDRANESPHTEK